MEEYIKEYIIIRILSKIAPVTVVTIIISLVFVLFGAFGKKPLISLISIIFLISAVVVLASSAILMAYISRRMTRRCDQEILEFEAFIEKQEKLSLGSKLH